MLEKEINNGSQKNYAGQNLSIIKKRIHFFRICLLPDERSERKMTPKNEDTFADLNPEFYDSVIFPASQITLKN